MGLQSAMTTALTGLQAAETTIDVTGNNVANSNTVGFKESSVLFATQFLQTLSIGSAPGNQLGGTNPRQIGLGVKASETRANFTQGTIQISANPLDLALQGDGFLIAQGGQGEQLYTRAGQLSTNSNSEIVAPTGHRIMGYTVDDEFSIDQSELVPITIPLGEAAVAQATQNAFLTGTLNPEATLGDTPEVIQSQVLSDASIEVPDPDNLWTLSDLAEVSPPSVAGTATVAGAGGTLADGDYRYRFVFADAALTGTDPGVIRSQEGPASSATAVTTVAAGGTGSVDISGIPQPADPDFRYVRVYREDASVPGTFTYVDEIDTTLPGSTSFTDIGATSTVTLDDSSVDQASYGYHITFYNSATGEETRPTERVGSLAIADSGRRIRLDNLPQQDADTDNEVWTNIRIYRNVENQSENFYFLDEIDINETSYIDGTPDAEIVGNPQINLDGPAITSGKLAKDIILRDGSTFTQPFADLGTLSFAARRGGRQLAAKELEITETTTVQQLIDFMDEAMGIHNVSELPDSPFAGVRIVEGRIEVASDPGIENALSIGLSAFSFRSTDSSTSAPVAMNFSRTQAANGEGATADFVVYDSLGIPINVRITTVMEDQDGSTTTYRWFASSPDNEPLAGVDTVVGSGTLTFNSTGDLLAGDIPTIAIDRNQTASASPLEVVLNFDQVSGLAQTNNLGEPVSNLSVPRQDGFPPGVLTSFIITETGLIRGVFSNGTDRPLGQVLLARFSNNLGLQQVGDNLFQVGVNSGEAVVGRPGEAGLGTLLGGAVELSNTDIGQNLIELILASTQYRGNARVISAAQDLLDELMALRR